VDYAPYLYTVSTFLSTVRKKNTFPMTIRVKLRKGKVCFCCSLYAIVNGDIAHQKQQISGEKKISVLPGWVFPTRSVLWCRLGFWVFFGRIWVFVALQVSTHFITSSLTILTSMALKASCNESNDIYFAVHNKFRFFYCGYWDAADTSHASDASPLANIVTYLSLLIRWRHITQVRPH